MTIAVVCKNQATFRRYRKAHPTDTCVHVWEDYGVVAGVEIDSIVILQAHSDMHIYLHLEYNRFKPHRCLIGLLF